MSLRFNRNSPPKWNAKKSWVEFVCNDTTTRMPVLCAVSRAALEDSTGEAADSLSGIAVFSRHLARVVEAANAVCAAAESRPAGIVLVDSDDLLARTIAPHLAAAEFGQLGNRA